jgi:hypothetical protein
MNRKPFFKEKTWNRITYVVVGFVIFYFIVATAKADEFNASSLAEEEATLSERVAFTAGACGGLYWHLAVTKEQGTASYLRMANNWAAFLGGMIDDEPGAYRILAERSEELVAGETAGDITDEMLEAGLVACKNLEYVLAKELCASGDSFNNCKMP